MSAFPFDLDLPPAPGVLHRYVVVDVFTDRPTTGNQLAVFADGRPFSATQMQDLAREMAFAETVFLFPAQEDGDVKMRIFTPGAELPFAGHPVLGTSFVVGTALGRDVVRLETGLGVTPIELKRAEGRVVFGRMQQPIPKPVPFEHADALLAALGVSGSGLPIEAYRNGPFHVYVNLEDFDAVASVRPDFRAIAALGDIGAYVFAGSGAQWKSRVFVPWFGVNEDAATGSGAGPLAVHLARHGRIRFGDEIQITQGVELSRPSSLVARVTGAPDHIERVEVGGSAVIVARGDYRL